MYVIERKNLDQAGAAWEPIEDSWETQNHFDLEEMGDAAARALALRFDGDVAFRVVDHAGGVHLVVQVTKYLRVYKPRSSVPSVPEAIPPGFEVPMLSEVLEDSEARMAVYLLPAPLSQDATATKRKVTHESKR